MVGTYIKSSRSVSCKKDNSCSVLFLVISSEIISKRNSRALRKFLMVWIILIIFGRGIHKVQRECHMLYVVISHETEILCRL